MAKPTILFLAASVVLWVIEPAFAIWFRSYSVEWQTDTADVVVVGKMVPKIHGAPPIVYRDPRNFACRVVDTLKGDLSLEGKPHRDFSISNDSVDTWDRPFKAGDRVLLFLSKTEIEKGLKIENWINLTSPNGRKVTGNHMALNNDCTLLKTEEAILAVVKSRVASGSVPKRGLIVEFKPGGDYRHDFVITAEPRFRKRVLEQIASDAWYPRCKGIFNLISYPGEETEKILRELLEDDEITTAGIGRQKKEHYPVREVAFIALRLLGVGVPVPEGFHEDLYFPDFGHGFDNMDWFPRGDWRRLRDIAEPPPDPPFNFLMGQKPVNEDHNWLRFDSTFTFKADFTELREVVDKELLSKGFDIDKEDPREFGKEWRPVSYRRGDEIVAMYQNMKFFIPDPEKSQRGRGRVVQGWVSFHVKLKRHIQGVKDR